MDSHFRPWMLPEGVVEALPHDAEKLNNLEQIALSTFARWGYQPLRPPMLEYVDTFISGSPIGDLAAQTLQFKDQKSGRQLGLRADITPQIARIDAHYLKTDKVARYAYAGEVVYSYASGYDSARNPTVVGAELLGSASGQADIEIVNLLIAFLKAVKLPGFIIELGSVDLVVTLLSALGIAESQYPQFFDALAKKDREKLNTLAQRNAVPESQKHILPALTTLYGDAAILPAADMLLADYADVLTEVKRLSQTMTLLQQQHPEVVFHVDLSDVRGYGYHNGLIFSAYTDGIWQAIARGGRYDSFGNHFGEQAVLRPSTGFSCHLNLLLPLLGNVQQSGRVIACPFAAGDDISRLVAELRAQGDTVINVFEDNLEPLTSCTHRIEPTADGYTVIAINESF